VRPLRLSAYAGALCALASLGLLAYTVYAWREDRTVRGWASLMSVVLLLGAVQLLVLGMIGEYLGRLFLEAKRRPLFVIDEVRCGPGVVRNLPPRGDVPDQYVPSPRRPL
jgi:dolichol-phosphate mannosyltransferase